MSSEDNELIKVSDITEDLKPLGRERLLKLHNHLHEIGRGFGYTLHDIIRTILDDMS